MSVHRSSRLLPVHLLVLASLLASFVALAPPLPQAYANPTSVTIAGSLQSELGCPGDWDPACAATPLTYDASDDVWQSTWTVPAGDWEYKAALNDDWAENYGLHAAPGGVVLTRLDATHWTITLTGKEMTQIEYKYALGSWDFVEKDGACGEIGNRQLTLSYGATGTQTVNDTVLNWRNVAPCGN